MAIRVGPAGWSYKDWQGIVYPPGASSRFDPLSYLAGYFDTIEVNSSYYRIPPVTHPKSWVKRVQSNENFRFTTKLYKGFTHDAGMPSSEEVDAYRAYLDVLAEAGRLGAVLVQFPWSFKNDEASRSRLEQVLEQFGAYPLAVEVRHGSFQNEEFTRYLEGSGVALTMIDQPLFGDSVRPSEVVTGPLGYVRFHGRNYEKWFQHEESWERYDYLYTEKELAPWVERIDRMAEKKDVYVVTNNHFRGQAIVNAVDLKRSLGQDAEAPPPLRQAYPDHFATGAAE